MKIAFVAYDLNPTLGSEAGKAHIWLKTISKHYNVEAFTIDKHQEDILNERYDNVKFYFINVPSLLLKNFILPKKIAFYPLSSFLFAQKVKKLLKNHRDICLIHCLTPSGIHSFNKLYKLNLPLIAGPVGGGLELPQGFKNIENRFFSFPRNFYYKVIKFFPAWKKYFNHATTILIGTEYLKTKLPEGSRKKAQIFFDTVVNPDIFAPISKKTNDITICYVGRIEYHKGITLLIEAFEELLKDYSNIKLVIAGKGSYSRVIPLNNDKIKYEGRISRNEVITLLNQSDIYCLPTLREPGGASILEAMSCGLPVVTTNYGGPATSVTNECGFKIDPLNERYYVKQLICHLKTLIDNPKLRKEMGAAGRKRIQREFSPAAIDKKIIQVYEGAVCCNGRKSLPKNK